MMAERNMEDRRRYPRYAADWRASIMNKSDSEREIFHGLISNISIGGAGVLSRTNIYTDEPLVMLVETPVPYGSVKKVITGIECNMCSVIFLPEQGKFHIGLSFVRFHHIGKHWLAEALFSQSAVNASRKQESGSVLQ